LQKCEKSGERVSQNSRLSKDITGNINLERDAVVIIKASFPNIIASGQRQALKNLKRVGIATAALQK
jgi:hypothetical protein